MVGSDSYPHKSILTTWKCDVYSPLQHLMETTTGDKVVVAHVQACTTMLEENYRSHPSIITLVNRFYDNKLRVPASGSRYSLQWSHPHVVWHHGSSMEQFEFNSPSIFNMEQVEQALNYVDMVVDKWRVPIADVVILAPYIKQVQKLREMLRVTRPSLYANNPDLLKRNVCSIEAFQGREARVVIITTVRTTDDVELLKADCRRHLGFLCQAQRTNVAVSRAIDSMIILGNLKLLARDAKTWGPLLRTSTDDTSHVIQGLDRATLRNVLDQGGNAIQLLLDAQAPTPDDTTPVLDADAAAARRLDD